MLPKIGLALVCLLIVQGLSDANLSQDINNNPGIGRSSGSAQAQGYYDNNNNQGLGQASNYQGLGQGQPQNQGYYGNNNQGLGQGLGQTRDYNNNQGLGQGQPQNQGYYGNNNNNNQADLGQGYASNYDGQSRYALPQDESRVVQAAVYPQQQQTGLGQGLQPAVQAGNQGLTQAYGSPIAVSNQGQRSLPLNGYRGKRSNKKDKPHKRVIRSPNLGQQIQPQGLGQGTQPQGLGQGNNGLGQGEQPSIVYAGQPSLGQGSQGLGQGGSIGGSLRAKRYVEREPYRKTCNSYYGKYICYRLYENDAAIPNDFTCWSTYLGKKNCTETENILYLDRRNVEVDPSELDRRFYTDDNGRRLAYNPTAVESRSSYDPRAIESRRDHYRQRDDEFGAIEKNLHNRRTEERQLPHEQEDRRSSARVYDNREIQRDR